MNKKIYKIGKKGEASHRATTEYDVTEKDITPIGGFPHYGVIDEDYVMIKARSTASSGDPCCLSSDHPPLGKSPFKDEQQIHGVGYDALVCSFWHRGVLLACLTQHGL